MSKTKITADLVGADSPLVGNTLLEGEDRVTVGSVVDPTGESPTVLKSLRLPQDLVEAIADSGHPDGFTGVVREALIEWQQRHQGRPAEITDARHAVATLARLVERLESVA
jgi:hypothetical protein